MAQHNEVEFEKKICEHPAARGWLTDTQPDQLKKQMNLRNLDRMIQPENDTAPIELSDVVPRSVKQIDQCRIDIGLGGASRIVRGDRGRIREKRDPKMVAFQQVLDRLSDRRCRHRCHRRQPSRPREDERLRLHQRGLHQRAGPDARDLRHREVVLPGCLRRRVNAAVSAPW